MAEVKGERGYLGFSIGAGAGGLVVATVDRTGPAFAAGLRRGDRLVQVDGEDASALDKKAAAARLRKEAGSTVTLEVAREGEGTLALQLVSTARAPAPRLSAKGLLGGLALVAVIGAIVGLSVGGTAAHRDVAEAFVSHLQQDDPRAAFALFAPDRQRALSFESWRASDMTSTLRGSADLQLGQASGGSDGRGCVAASVATSGGRFYFVVYTLVGDEGASLHSVLANEAQRGWLDQGPWRCW